MESKQEVIINIHSQGDMSVGIPSVDDSITIQLPDFYDDDEERERVRDIFGTAFKELYDDGVDITFGDECPDCKGRSGEHKPSCPSGEDF
jgi:hypothetical protein